MVRTIWFAGFLLLIIGGLFAMKMVSATVSGSDETPGDATAALMQVLPGENTLTETDRVVAAPDPDAAPLQLVESSTVSLAHAEYVPPAATRKRTRTVAKPRTAVSKPVKTTELRSCRQLDPIARFLVSTNLAPPCAG